MKHRTLLLLMAVTLASSCYQTRRSKGGGQVGADSTRKIEPADIMLPDGYRAEAMLMWGDSYPF